MSNKEHVILGMSGGVDSSVSAYLLQQQGYRVEGVFMQNWRDDDPYCSASHDLSDARSVCDKLGIPLRTVNFAQEYWDSVFQVFLDEYAAGRTPNPDILCNREIKFKAFLDYALALGADYLATGHYARKTDYQSTTQLLAAHDWNKDQSYFLCAISQHALQHSIFPIGHLEKSEVRRIAQQLGLANYQKKDSTGICFIGERKFRQFLNEYLLAQPGIIRTDTGEKIGQHSGLFFYTLGQRQGLQIGGQKGAQEKPWYVIAKNLTDNELIVAQDSNHPLLMANELSCASPHWIGTTPNLPLRCQAKIRYRQQAQPCFFTLTPQGEGHVIFDQPQRAITPGQFVVFYQGEECLGGGVINTVFNNSANR